MRILALDLGERHIGAAISDESGRIAFPCTVLEKGEKFFQELKKIVEDYHVEKIVIGHPLDIRGEEGKEGRKSRKEAEGLKDILKIDCVLWDERYTSRQASDILRGKGKKKKESEHMIAATILLQSYLDCLRTEGRSED
ncbi:MAG: Holliday junction resolvase RuvX [bacterium]